MVGEVTNFNQKGKAESIKPFAKDYQNEKSINPARRKGWTPKVVSDTVACTGGACMSCGTPLKSWFNYQLCDRCLVIPERAVVQL